MAEWAVLGKEKERPVEMGRDVTYRNRTLAQRHNIRTHVETDAK